MFRESHKISLYIYIFLYVVTMSITQNRVIYLGNDVNKLLFLIYFVYLTSYVT